jgi:DNA-binding CsgD family transcriptional regulator
VAGCGWPSRAREALDDLLECGRRQEAWGARNPAVLPWRSAAALAHVALGERDAARALSDEELELARAAESSRATGEALRVAGLVHGGRRGLRLLGEAVETLADSPARLEHARALVDQGAALRRAGQRVRAREPLRAGLDLASRCGAGALVEQARTELRAAGARPRRLVLTGVDSLTASELRVAEMAAEGLSNRDIAQGLFVTLKTVELHLRNVYRKLDIDSRGQLHDALDARPASYAQR